MQFVQGELNSLIYEHFHLKAHLIKSHIQHYIFAFYICTVIIRYLVTASK